MSGIVKMKVANYEGLHVVQGCARQVVKAYLKAKSWPNGVGLCCMKPLGKDNTITTILVAAIVRA